MLDVTLLGVPSVRRADRSAVRLSTGQLHLFALLLMHRGRPVPRSSIVLALWGDGLTGRRAGARLSTALWRLRSRLEGDLVPRGTYIDATSDDGIAVNDDEIELDVARFEDIVTDLCDLDKLGVAGASALTAAVAAYQGDLLEGSDAGWITTERERLVNLYLAGLTHLVNWHVGRREYAAGADHAQRILERDPLREDIHRALISCHALRGDHEQAVERYRRCERVLRDATGRGPHLETWLAVTAARRPGRRVEVATGGAPVDTVDEPTADVDPAVRFVVELTRAIRELGTHA